MDRIKRKASQKAWYERNKLKPEWVEKRKIQSKQYKELNSEKVKLYQENNRKSFSKKQKRNRAINKASWSKIITNNLDCPICGIKIYFNCGNWIKSINFDHRNGGTEIIKGSPSNWLSRHVCNEENIKIWNSCDFGMLCIRCNKMIPTKNRVDWLNKLNKYILSGNL